MAGDLAIYFPGEGPIPIVDFLEWKNLPRPVHAALALFNHLVFEFRELVEASIQKRVKHQFVDGDNAPFYGAYDRETNTIYLNDGVVFKEGFDVLAGVLAHEIMHACMGWRRGRRQETRRGGSTRNSFASRPA